MEIRHPSASAINKLKTEPDHVILDALAGAFALVATADGEVHELEMSRFFDLIKNLEKLQHIPWDRVDSTFKVKIDQIAKNDSVGREMALNAIRAAKGSSDNADLILSASQAAIVADMRLKEVEEVVLRQICDVLGVDPDAY